jgi:hypothetical protein
MSVYCSHKIVGFKLSNNTGASYKNTSGFWPRVRARALRAPVFLSSLAPETGRCAPPPRLRSFAASYSTHKNI